MIGLLSLPTELLYKIIETCSERERRHLRATCKVLNEHADPIVFRRLRLNFRGELRIIEHQIISLATRSSKACEFTKDLVIHSIPDGIRTSEKSLPHFDHCDDLRVHLPTVMSTLKNMTKFGWVISDYDPQWLIDALIQVVARLPHLTDLIVGTWNKTTNVRVPLGLFANLSKLVVNCTTDDVSFFMSEMATLIANSPQLKSLRVTYHRMLNTLPTLSELFAKASAENPLFLEHLSIEYMDATVDQVVFPHLAHLTSFEFLLRSGDFSVARSVWTSFLVNDINLSAVDIGGSITKETLLYLSSFSGLKRLAMRFVNTPPNITMENLENTLFTVVLPKHVDSLQTLEIANSPRICDRASSNSIMKCLNLRDVNVRIDGKESGMSVQLFLDTVAHLPELRNLRIYTLNPRAGRDGLLNFKPAKGLRYVEEVIFDYIRYVLVKDGERPMRYRKG